VLIGDRVDVRDPSSDLDEHTEVQVLVPTEARTDADDPTGWKAAEALIGLIEDAPVDMAERHDHYLYSRPDA